MVIQKLVVISLVSMRRTLEIYSRSTLGGGQPCKMCLRFVHFLFLVFVIYIPRSYLRDYMISLSEDTSVLYILTYIHQLQYNHTLSEP